MIKITDAVISLETIGKRYLLAGVAPVREYVNGHATDNIAAYRYNIILLDKKHAEFTVKIDGPKQMDEPEDTVPVEFDNLTIKVSWSKGENVLIGHATGIHPLLNAEKTEDKKH